MAFDLLGGPVSSVLFNIPKDHFARRLSCSNSGLAQSIGKRLTAKLDLVGNGVKSLADQTRSRARTAFEQAIDQLQDHLDSLGQPPVAASNNHQKVTKQLSAVAVEYRTFFNDFAPTAFYTKLEEAYEHAVCYYADKENTKPSERMEMLAIMLIYATLNNRNNDFATQAKHWERILDEIISDTKLTNTLGRRRSLLRLRTNADRARLVTFLDDFQEVVKAYGQSAGSFDSAFDSLYSKWLNLREKLTVDADNLLVDKLVDLRDVKSNEFFQQYKQKFEAYFSRTSVSPLPFGGRLFDLADIYVNLRMEQMGPNGVARHTLYDDYVDCLDTAFESSDCAIIVAEPGGGKSLLTTVKVPFDNLAGRLPNYDVLLVARLCELVGRGPFESGVELALCWLDCKVEPPSINFKALARRLINAASDDALRLLVILDGLEEVSGAWLKQTCPSLHGLLYSGYKLPYKVLFSCRPFKLSEIPRPAFTELRLMPLTEVQQQEYVDKYFPGDEFSERRLAIRGLLEQNVNVASLALNPQMIMLVCFVYEYGESFVKHQASAAVCNQAQLFQCIVDMLMEQARHRLPMKEMPYPQSFVQLGEMALDFLMREDQGASLLFSSRDLLHYRVDEPFWLETGILTQDTRNKHLRVPSQFLHKTFQEFAAATYICSSFEVVKNMLQAATENTDGVKFVMDNKRAIRKECQVLDNILKYCGKRRENWYNLLQVFNFLLGMGANERLDDAIVFLIISVTATEFYPKTSDRCAWKMAPFGGSWARHLDMVALLQRRCHLECLQKLVNIFVVESLYSLQSVPEVLEQLDKISQQKPLWLERVGVDDRLLLSRFSQALLAHADNASRQPFADVSAEELTRLDWLMLHCDGTFAFVLDVLASVADLCVDGLRFNHCRVNVRSVGASLSSARQFFSSVHTQSLTIIFDPAIGQEDMERSLIGLLLCFDGVAVFDFQSFWTVGSHWSARFFRDDQFVSAFLSQIGATIKLIYVNALIFDNESDMQGLGQFIKRIAAEKPAGSQQLNACMLGNCRVSLTMLCEWARALREAGITRFLSWNLSVCNSAADFQRLCNVLADTADVQEGFWQISMNRWQMNDGSSFLTRPMVNILIDSLVGIASLRHLNLNFNDALTHDLIDDIRRAIAAENKNRAVNMCITLNL